MQQAGASDGPRFNPVLRDRYVTSRASITSLGHGAMTSTWRDLGVGSVWVSEEDPKRLFENTLVTSPRFVSIREETRAHIQ